MKLPSLQTLGQSFIAVIKRFPFECLFALLGTIVAHRQIDLPYQDRSFLYSQLLMTANLGLILSLFVTLFTEGKGLGFTNKFILKTLFALISLALFFFFNDDSQKTYIRFFSLSLTFHLGVSFAAFIGINQVHGFWQFNKVLFLRILTALLYSVVLFCGISAALAASDFLFNLHLKGEIYVKLWFWILGIFNTLFFLAGVPDNYLELDNDESYPKGLKVFTQFVLLPLTTLYLVILLAYELKIIINWSLPKGYVSNLILGYAIFGILGLLLIYPIRQLEGNKWITSFSKFFYFLMIPLIILLFIAMSTRISIYGITEKRYFLLLLACWLTGITVYFLISKKQNIKIIPISLAIITLLTVYGPLSANSVSFYSQTKTLEQLFKKYGAFKYGKFTSLEKMKISKRDGNHMVAIIEYLVRTNDFTSLQPYCKENLNLINESVNHGDIYNSYYPKVDWYKSYWGLKKYDGYNWYKADLGESHIDEKAVEFKDYIFSSENKNAINIKGYDVLIHHQFNEAIQNCKIGNKDVIVTFLKKANDNYQIQIENETMDFNLDSIGKKLMVNKDSFLLKTKFNGATKEYEVPFSSFSVLKESKHYVVLFSMPELNIAENVADKTISASVTGNTPYILIKEK